MRCAVVVCVRIEEMGMTRRDFLAEIEKIVEAKAGSLKGDEPLS